MAQETSLVQLLKDLGPWIISFVVLAQFWVIAAWKRFIQKGRVEIYESGALEVSYGTFGPSISLTGTLRAINKDIFIRQIRIRVTRQKDGARFLFNWRAFRPNTIQLVGQQIATLELASSFLLTTDAPHKLQHLLCRRFIYRRFKSENHTAHQKMGGIRQNPIGRT